MTAKSTWYVWSKKSGSNSANWVADDPATFVGTASERDAHLSKRRNETDGKTFAATETNSPPNS